MRRALTASVLAAVLTLGGVAPAFADDGPPASPPPSAPVLSAPPAPAVEGRARDGSTLRVRLDGLRWGGTPDAVSVQWQRDGKDVAGATAPSYPLREADVDHALRARITATAGGAAVSVVTKRRTVQPGTSSERRLRARLTALRRTLPGTYTVEVDELDGGRRHVAIDAARHREPASVFKLFVAYGVYTRIDRGQLHYGDRLASGLTVRSCLRAMIEPSDNYCATDLRLRIGNAWLNALLHSHGLTGTTFWYDGHRTKTTTTADVTTVLARLARGELLSTASTAAMLRQLETQVWREAIPPGLPDGVRQASKCGTLWTATGMVQTDSAIVWGKRSRYVLTVMGANGATIPSITKISKAVHRELEGPIGRPFVYDRQQMRATGPLVLTASASRGSRVLGRYGTGTKVEVIDSLRSRYLVRIAGRTGWVDNTHLTLRHKVL